MDGKFDAIEELERPSRHPRATRIVLLQPFLLLRVFRYSLVVLLSDLDPEDYHKTRSRT